MTQNELLVRQLARMECTCTEAQKIEKELPVCIPCCAKSVLDRVEEMAEDEYTLFLSTC